MTSMNKKQLAAELAELHGLTPTEATERVDQVFDTVIRVLVSGKARRIAITGVGVFEEVVYKARQAWNLHTDTRVAVPERRSMRFRPGRAFKAMMDGKLELPSDRSAALKSRSGKAVKPKETGDGA